MTTRADTKGSGWRIFAGLMILLVGAFNFIDGIVAVANPHYYYYYETGTNNSSVTVHHLVFGTLNGWGWGILILGIVQVLVALAIFAGQAWAAVLGIVVAVLNAIGQLLLISVFPWWSVITIAIDVLIIYALAVYGFVDRLE